MEIILDSFKETFQCIIYGYTGCGKSNIIKFVLMNIEELNFSKLLVISEECQPGRQYDFLPEECKSTTIDFNKINALRPANRHMDRRRSLVIFDDIIGLFNNENKMRVQAMFSNIRKDYISTIISLQSLTAIPPMCRNQASIAFIGSLDKNSQDFIRSFNGQIVRQVPCERYIFLFMTKSGAFMYIKFENFDDAI